jgi:hypothetical protein
VSSRLTSRLINRLINKDTVRIIYIILQDYILNKAVLSRVLIGVNLGSLSLALFRFFTKVVSP